MPPRFLHTPNPNYHHPRICNQFDAVSIVTTHHINMLTVQSFHAAYTCCCHRLPGHSFRFVRRRKCFNHPEAIANHSLKMQRIPSIRRCLYQCLYRRLPYCCGCVWFSNWHSTQGCECMQRYYFVLLLGYDFCNWYYRRGEPKRRSTDLNKLRIARIRWKFNTGITKWWHAGVHLLADHLCGVFGWIMNKWILFLGQDWLWILGFPCKSDSCRWALRLNLFFISDPSLEEDATGGTCFSVAIDMNEVVVVSINRWLTGLKIEQIFDFGVEGLMGCWVVSLWFKNCRLTKWIRTLGGKMWFG